MFLEKAFSIKKERQTLIKNTLCNLLIDFMSLFAISKRVAMRLENIQRNFLWSVIYMEKQKEGLGIRSLSILNKALLGK